MTTARDKGQDPTTCARAPSRGLKVPESKLDTWEAGSAAFIRNDKIAAAEASFFLRRASTGYRGARSWQPPFWWPSFRVLRTRLEIVRACHCADRQTPTWLRSHRYCHASLATLFATHCNRKTYGSPSCTAKGAVVRWRLVSTSFSTADADTSGFASNQKINVFSQYYMHLGLRYLWKRERLVKQSGLCLLIF